MKLLSAAVIAVALISNADAKPHKTVRDTIKTVRWEGMTDLDMLKQARSDIDDAITRHVTTLRVSIFSPGGPVITSLEIARLVRDTTENTGLVIEIHAEALCASGCTFVLASGTPHHRFISRWALFLVHPMQVDGECAVRVADPQTQQEKANDVLFDLMRDHYIRYSGRSADEVTGWLTCGHERVGRGDLAVSLNLADATE